MKQPKIMCDETEMVVIDETSDRRTMGRIKYSQITNIALDECIGRSFFREIPSEKISINVSSREEPLVYYKHKNMDQWDSYVAQIRKFCKDNRVSLYDNLKK